MQKLFIHIGMMKTGSTALQSFCRANRDWLRDRGFVYPLIYGTDSHRFWGRRVVRHPVRSQKFRSAVDYWRRHVRPTLERASGHTPIISYEGLWRLGCVGDVRTRAAVVAECLRGYDVHVVAYVRRQDLWYESLYNERVKNAAETRKLPEFIRELHEERRGDAAQNLGVWRDLYGAANVQVRVYERDQLRGDVVNDFLGELGITDASGAKAAPSSNPRLATRLIGPMLSFNRLTARLPAQIAGRALASSVQRLLRDESSRLLTPEEAIAVYDVYRAGNEAVAREYLARPDGRLFLRLPEEEPAWVVGHRAWS